MDYQMQFLEFLSLLQKYGLSYAISIISIPSPKTWTIICNFGNFFPFSINVWNLWNFFLFSKNMDYHIQFLDFLSLFKKHGLSYAIFRSYYPFSKNLDYHIQILEFLSLLQKRGLSYPSFKNFFPFSKKVDYHM